MDCCFRVCAAELNGITVSLGEDWNPSLMLVVMLAAVSINSINPNNGNVYALKSYPRVIIAVDADG